MRMLRKDFGLLGPVYRAETRSVSATKGYKNGADSRELLPLYAKTSSDSSESSSLEEVLVFDAYGKLIEDVDLIRSYDQDSYRCVYTYNSAGQLSKKAGFNADGSPHDTTDYIYGPTGKKVEEEIHFGDGHSKTRKTFDEHENMILTEYFAHDGMVRREHHRYEYQTKGNTFEQIYFPPPRDGLRVSPTHDQQSQSILKTDTQEAFRTVFVRDDNGKLRQETRYLPGGSLMEQKTFDENGVLRISQWTIQGLYSTTTTFDETGREIESHLIAKKGLASPQEIDGRSAFVYDTHGNVTEETTRNPDGLVTRRRTVALEYDHYGNWIKKTESSVADVPHTEAWRLTLETVTVEHRRITYF
jgi:hypothetical protein